jgi:hypothetical protein
MVLGGGTFREWVKELKVTSYELPATSCAAPLAVIKLSGWTTTAAWAHCAAS